MTTLLPHLVFAILLAGYLASPQAEGATFQAETLANGTRVYIAHTPGHQRTVFRLGSTLGPDDVPCSKLQLPHLTEHLMFEGLGKEGRESLGRLMDRHAGEINAITHPTAITVMGYIHSRFTRETIGLLAEAINYRDSLNILLERERKIIQAELDYDPINSHIGHATSTTYDLLIRRSPGECGRDRSIITITEQDVASFWRDLFDPRNLTLYVSTDVPASELMPAIREAFGSRPQTGRELPVTTRPPAKTEAYLKTLRWSGGDKTEVGAVMYVDPSNTNVMAQKFLELLLQVETDQAVRQQGGHTYHVNVSYHPSSSAITISTVPRPGEARAAMAALRNAIDRVLAGDLAEEFFAEQRLAHSLRVSAYGTSPELNIQHAVWRSAALSAGVDVTGVTQLETMSQKKFAQFSRSWLVGEPIYFEERRPASYVPWWLPIAVVAGLLGLLIPWQKARRAVASFRKKAASHTP